MDTAHVNIVNLEFFIELSVVKVRNNEDFLY